MHTIYELTEAERDVMRKLIEQGLVVRTGDHAKVKDENQRFRNGFANLSQALQDAPGLPIECLSEEDQAKWTDLIASILMVMGVLESTGKPLHIFEALIEATETARA